LLTDALGKENVLGVSMPSKITSDESKSDAKTLAENLGINFVEIPIKNIVDAVSTEFSDLFKNVEKNWNFRYKQSFTHDNIQARSRATILFGISNEFSSCIPIATSDKSEAYMGYATIKGDMSGGYAPIADITKTKLFALARWLNKNRKEKNAIPESVILKRPGAELAINPKTGKPLIAEDALMPYEFLDEVIWRIENKNEGYNELLNVEFVYEKHNKISKEQKVEWLNKFYRRLSSALYKWSIAAPSVMTEEHSINKCDYFQPITSSRINYKGVSDEYISENLK
jgi:NAD+ synthetase